MALCAVANLISLFVLSLRFPNSWPVAPIKTTSVKLLCIGLTGFAFPGSLIKYKVIRNSGV